MKIELMERQAKHVHIFWKETQTELLRDLFPFTIKSEAEALSLFEATQLEGANSFGQVIYVGGVYIGDVWCYGLHDDMPMLSIVIFDQTFWGKGIATQAIPLFLKTLVSKFGVRQMGAFTFSTNKASQKALVKSGFVEQYTFHENGVDSVFFQIHFPQ